MTSRTAFGSVTCPLLESRPTARLVVLRLVLDVKIQAPGAGVKDMGRDRGCYFIPSRNALACQVAPEKRGCRDEVHGSGSESEPEPESESELDGVGAGRRSRSGSSSGSASLRPAAPRVSCCRCPLPAPCLRS